MKKILFGFIVMFAFGSVSGAFFGARMQNERHEKRDKVDNLEVNIMEVLESKLSLEPDQVEVIEPMVDQACVEIRDVYQRSADEIEFIVLKYHDLIATELTPTQDKIFKELEADRKRRNAEKSKQLSTRL